MYLLPTKFGPLNAKIDALMVALVLFTIVFLWFKRLLPRINQVLAERADRTEGALERAEAIRAEAAAEHRRRPGPARRGPSRRRQGHAGGTRGRRGADSRRP